jgi:hypothetical protein
VPEQRLIFARCIGEHRERLLWNQQHMNRRLWPDVAKREAKVIFVNDVGSQFVADDLAEYGFRHNDSPAMLL